MKRSVIERVLVGVLLVIAVGIVLHAPLTVWLGTVWPAYDQVIKAWKEVLMGIALVLLVVIAVQKRKTGQLLRDRVMQLAIVYAGLHMLMIAVFQNGLEFAGAGLLIDLRYVLYFVLVYGTVQLLPQYRTVLIKALTGGAIIVLGFALLQLFVLPHDFLTIIGYGKDTIAPYMTVDQNVSYIRINSTLRGPNPLGAYAVIVLSIVLAYAIKHGRRLKRQKLWVLGALAAVAGMVLGATYSRSSFIAVLVALGVTIGAIATAKVRRHLAIGTAIGMLLVLAVLVIGRSDPVISNIVWHDNPTGGSAVDSNEGHVDSLVDGTNRLLRQPFGAGIGSTGSASLDSDKPLIIENQYLFIAHEVGWIGLIVFVWLFVEIMRRLWLRRHGALALGVFASGCGLAVIGLLLPVWVDDTVSIIWWGLAAVAVGGIYEVKHGTRKSN